jgi:hypothetical protein
MQSLRPLLLWGGWGLFLPALLAGCTAGKPWPGFGSAQGGKSPPPGPVAAPIVDSTQQARQQSEWKERYEQEQLAHQLARQRIAKMQEEIDERDRALKAAQLDIQSAAEEVSRTRAELQQWKAEVVRLREGLRDAEKQNMETLQTMIKLMEQRLEQPAGGAPEEPRRFPAPRTEPSP